MLLTAAAINRSFKNVSCTFSKNANSEKVPTFWASAKDTSLIALLDFF